LKEDPKELFQISYKNIKYVPADRLKELTKDLSLNGQMIINRMRSKDFEKELNNHKNLIFSLKKIKDKKSIAFMETFEEKITPFIERWLQILVERFPDLKKKKKII
jgi:hypothetical protein